MENKQIETETKSPTVPMGVFRKLYSKLEQYSDDTQLTLELILTALFPTVWNNIQRQMNDCLNTIFSIAYIGFR